MNSIKFLIKRLKSLNNSSKWNLLIGGTIVLTILSLYLKYKSFEEEFHLSMVPDGLNISKILYINEQNFGLGPGGNETGLIVYELPDKISSEIKKNGVTYFTNMPKNREQRGDYVHWHSTPIFSDKSTPSLPSALKISSYLDQYGFGLKIDPLIENQVDETLSNSVSYVGYGRIGMLIVAPEIKKVFFAYAG